MENTRFEKLATNGFLFSLGMLYSMPMGFIAGLRIKKLTEDSASTTVKSGWINNNPFRSMYFAVLSMAAELSTGVLLIRGTQNSKPATSMLVVKNSASYFKKAVGKITFTCVDGKLITDSINKAKQTGEGVLIETKTIGKDSAGDVVAEFEFTWSIKVKSSK
jgi:Domain of unknown function (DUF4442)